MRGMLSVLAVGKMLTPSFKSTVSQGPYEGKNFQVGDVGVMKTTVYSQTDRKGHLKMNAPSATVLFSE